MLFCLETLFFREIAVMSRRRVITPATYIRGLGPHRRVTSCAVGRHHLRMRERGYVTSTPVSEDPRRSRVWINRDDPRAPLMNEAVAEEIVAKDSVSRSLGLKRTTDMPYGQLSLLGIVAVPVDEQRVRLVGTSPVAARIANHVYWGRRRRHVSAEELIELTFELVPNGRKTTVTDPRIETSLEFFFDRFGIDFSDVIDRVPILV